MPLKARYVDLDKALVPAADQVSPKIAELLDAERLSIAAEWRHFVYPMPVLPSLIQHDQSAQVPDRLGQTVPDQLASDSVRTERQAPETEVETHIVQRSQDWIAVQLHNRLDVTSWREHAGDDTSLARSHQGAQKRSRKP
jgi:hypothetical protein